MRRTRVYAGGRVLRKATNPIWFVTKFMLTTILLGLMLGGSIAYIILK